MLRGVAMARGMAWAQRVAGKVRHRPPWPAYEGKARRIALRLVTRLTTDERLLERLARRCWADGQRWWERMRSGDASINRAG